MLSRYNTFLANARSADNYLNRPALAAGIGAAAATNLINISKGNIDNLAEAMSTIPDPDDPSVAANAFIKAKEAAKNLLLNIRNAIDDIRATDPAEGSELKNIEEALENHHIVMQDEALVAAGEKAENKYLSMLHPGYFAADMCCLNSRGNMHNVSNPEPWGTVPFDLMPANNIRYGFSFTPVFDHTDTQPYYKRRSPEVGDVDFIDHQTAEVWWGIDTNNIQICDSCISMRDFMVNNGVDDPELKAAMLAYVNGVLEFLNANEAEISRLAGVVRRHTIGIDANGVEDEDATAIIENELQLSEDSNSAQRNATTNIYDSFKNTLTNKDNTVCNAIDEMASQLSTIEDFISNTKIYRNLYNTIKESPNYVIRPGDFSIALLEIITLLDELIAIMALDDLRDFATYPRVMLATADTSPGEDFVFNGFFTTFINHDEKDGDRGIIDGSYQSRKPSYDVAGNIVYIDDADHAGYGKSTWGFRQKMEHVFPMDTQDCVESACKWIRPMNCKDGKPLSDSCLPGKLVIQLVKRKKALPKNDNEPPVNARFVWDPDQSCAIDFSDAVMHCSMKMETVYSYDIEEILSVISENILPYKKNVLSNIIPKNIVIRK